MADDKMPAGIQTSETWDDGLIIRGNRVAGVDGSCYYSNGIKCDSSEACNGASIQGTWSDNIGHSCIRGFYIWRAGQDQCTKVQGFHFYKMTGYGVTTLSKTTTLGQVEQKIIISF